MPYREKAPEFSERVLVYVKGEHEGRLTIKLLARDGLFGIICESVPQLCEAMRDGAGAVLIAEELLTTACVRRIKQVLKDQPAWSDYPLVIFSAPAEVRDGFSPHISRLGNVTFLDRPVHVRTMLAAVHAAIVSRRRQYEARRAIESRDAFLAMLGHELRNPLGAISLAIAVIPDKFPGIERCSEFVIIERQSQHLGRLVDDLLDVARISHGKVVLQREAIDLVDVVRNAFETQAARADQQRLTYQCDVGKVPVWVRGDRQRLEQVFANLITNAIKYTESGGSIKVSLRADNQTAVVEVSDTGIGLTPEASQQIFDPFVQVGTTSEGGLGLGLALVRSIVALHRGHVEARSTGLGKGSTFRVTLQQLVDHQQAAAPESDSADAILSSKKILAVDDNADIRETLAELLRRAGHEVTCAHDGPKGLQLLLSNPPDIAFIDLGLPGLDGLEVARRARASGSATYLVALTGYGQAEDKERAMDAGFNDYLVKPVHGPDLEQAIRQAQTFTAPAG